MRRYSQAEANAILRLAAVTPEQGVEAEGLTLEELERIAQELGIAPERVRAAAVETEKPPGFYGVQDMIVEERSLAWQHGRGATLAMREAFEGQMGGISNSSQSGAGDDWTISTPPASFVSAWTASAVSGSSHLGRTRIRASTDLRFAKGAAIAIANPIMLLGIVLTLLGVLKDRFPVFMLAMVLVYLIVPHVCMRGIVRGMARKAREKQSRAIDAIEAAMNAERSDGNSLAQLPEPLREDVHPGEQHIEE